MTGTVQPYEKEFFHKDGSRVPVLLGAANFDETDQQGVAFVLDLTERKRAEETLRNAQTELAHTNRVATMGQLTASIIHEVGQPIAAAITNAQAGLLWFEKEPPALDEVRQSLGDILKSGYWARDVLNRIRALIKKAPLRTDLLDINGAICEVMKLTRGETERNGVSVRTELAEGLPLMRGDRVQIQQVLLNLVMNAIEAMSGTSEGERTLSIRTSQTAADSVLVAVGDSGPGFAPLNAEHLFEAFHTTKANGLGLGLSICRSIIETNGGRLWASPNLPRGAVFQFTLPAGLESAS